METPTEGRSLTETRFRRVVSPGMTRDGRVYITIEHMFDRNKMWELTLSGVEGPKADGDARGGAGQCRDFEIISYDEGWTVEMVDQLREVWERWHLNGMRAGSPAQEKYLREHPYNRERDGDHYDWARAILNRAGLQPDPNHIRNDKPYSYGSAWLYEAVPADVLDWLYNLPTAARPHPWGDSDLLVTP